MTRARRRLPLAQHHSRITLTRHRSEHARSRSRVLSCSRVFPRAPPRVSSTRGVEAATSAGLPLLQLLLQVYPGAVLELNELGQTPLHEAPPGAGERGLGVSGWRACSVVWLLSWPGPPRFAATASLLVVSSPVIIDVIDAPPPAALLSPAVDQKKRTASSGPVIRRSDANAP